MPLTSTRLLPAHQAKTAELNALKQQHRLLQKAAVAMSARPLHDNSFAPAFDWLVNPDEQARDSKCNSHCDSKCNVFLVNLDEQARPYLP